MSFEKKLSKVFEGRKLNQKIEGAGVEGFNIKNLSVEDMTKLAELSKEMADRYSRPNEEQELSKPEIIQMEKELLDLLDRGKNPEAKKFNASIFTMEEDDKPGLKREAPSPKFDLIAEALSKFMPTETEE